MALWRHRCHLTKSKTFLTRSHSLLHQMRQEYEYEEDGAYEHKGSKQSQIAQGRRIERYQRGKSTYSCDITYQQWGYHLLQHLAGRTSMIGMEHKVKRIVHCNTDNHGANAKHNQRYITTDDSHKAHRKEPAENDGHTNEHQMLHLTEGEYQKQQDECHSDRDSPLAVDLNLRSIAHCNHRGTRHSHINIGHALHRLLCSTIYLTDEHAVIG